MTALKWDHVGAVPIADTEVAARLRETSGPGVASIASSIAELGGILKPVLLRKIKGTYRLLDGLHRLEAAKEAGLLEVPASVTSCTNNEAVRIEVDANLASAPLTPLDMAVFLAAHKELYEKEHPETRQGSAGGRAKNEVHSDIMSVCTFATNAAEVFEKSKRQIYRLISIGQNLKPNDITHLRNAPNRVQFKDLELIAKSGNSAERAEICTALGTGEAKSAKEVLARRKQPGVATKSPVEQAQSKITDAWTRAPKEARRRFAEAHRDELRALMDDPETEVPTNDEADAAPTDAAGVINFQSRREMS